MLVFPRSQQVVCLLAEVMVVFFVCAVFLGKQPRSVSESVRVAVIAALAFRFSNPVEIDRLTCCCANNEEEGGEEEEGGDGGGGASQITKRPFEKVVI